MSFADIKKAADSTSKARKALEGVAFLAPESAPVITTLTDAEGELQALPPEYFPVGYVSTDGYTWGGDTDTEEVEALGYASPVRNDITKTTREVSFSAYNVYHANLLAVAYGMDLSEAKKAVSGEITFDRPALPDKIFYRLIVIAKDGSGANEIYRAKHNPRVSIVEIPEETWNASDAKAFEFKFAAEVDPLLGTAEREFIAGPGAKTQELGFKPAG